jgi:hypothetical protein
VAIRGRLFWNEFPLVPRFRVRETLTA